MTPPVMFSSVVPPAEKQEDEKDRYRLAAGIRFVITDVLIAPSTKYGKFAKINGYDLITNQRLKYRTTSGPVIQQLETLITNAGTDGNGHLKSEVKVFVGETKSATGKNYLSLQDPA